MCKIIIAIHNNFKGYVQVGIHNIVIKRSVYRDGSTHHHYLFTEVVGEGWNDLLQPRLSEIMEMPNFYYICDMWYV